MVRAERSPSSPPPALGRPDHVLLPWDGSGSPAQQWPLSYSQLPGPGVHSFGALLSSKPSLPTLSSVFGLDRPHLGTGPHLMPFPAPPSSGSYCGGLRDGNLVFRKHRKPLSYAGSVGIIGAADGRNVASHTRDTEVAPAPHPVGPRNPLRVEALGNPKLIIAHKAKAGGAGGPRTSQNLAARRDKNKRPGERHESPPHLLTPELRVCMSSSAGEADRAFPVTLGKRVITTGNTLTGGDASAPRTPVHIHRLRRKQPSPHPHHLPHGSSHPPVLAVVVLEDV